jgi:ELWxxDGT repeat protein
LVKDIQPGTGSGYPRDLLNVNGTLYFSADNGAVGEELWKSDGTASGTVLVHDLATGIGSSSPRGLIIAGSRLFAAATTDATGSELFSLNLAATSSFVSGFAIEGISSSSQAAAAVRSPELTGPGASHSANSFDGWRGNLPGQCVEPGRRFWFYSPCAIFFRIQGHSNRIGGAGPVFDDVRSIR